VGPVKIAQSSQVRTRSPASDTGAADRKRPQPLPAATPVMERPSSARFLRPVTFSLRLRTELRRCHLRRGGRAGIHRFEEKDQVDEPLGVCDADEHRLGLPSGNERSFGERSMRRAERVNTRRTTAARTERAGRCRGRLAFSSSGDTDLGYSKNLRPAPTLSIHQPSPPRNACKRTVSPFENLAAAHFPLITTSRTTAPANDL
jgi:hypothetical protein